MSTKTLLAIVTRLFGKRAGRYAKAILPALGGLVAVLAQWAATGALDQAELITAAVALGSALLTLATPNAPKRSRRSA